MNFKLFNAMVATTANWDIGNFLQNAQDAVKKWGGYVVVLFGLIMILVAAIQIGKGLMSHGKAQTNWMIVIVLLIVGGAFSVGGWNLVSGIAEGGKKTIEDLGVGGTILPMVRMWFPR